jgi:DNA repair protein RecN (Recombination protein N)
MLEDLVVEDLGVIERAEVRFGPGSSAVTGETGAGKTLVVAAVGLLLGDRAEKVLVRQGASKARVQGRFVLPPGHPALGVLEARGLVEDDSNEVVVTRTVPVTGAATTRINGQLATASILTEIAPSLVEIAGQHEHGRVSDPVWQRATLDAYAGAEALAEANSIASNFKSALHARRVLEVLTTNRRARERELDVLRYEIQEIERAAPDPEEAVRLAVEATRLEQAESIGTALSTAIDSLAGDGGAQEDVARATAELARLTDVDPEIAALAARLDQAQVEVEDIASELSRRMVAPDPVALESVRDRLGAMSRLKRKYGDSIDEVLRYLDEARRRRDELQSADEDVERWGEEARNHEAAALEAAGRLRALRTEAAANLARRVEKVLDDLALGGARFEIRLRERDLYEGGTEAVEFLVAANPGESPRPISKVASGGELSRIALALHLLTSSAGAATMVFDEVDAGVGGQAAQAVGRALADLARDGRQIFVVTHLPQVAAFADAHYRVVKTFEGERSSAHLEPVGGDERVAELSRMLAGLPASERAHEHAQELLDLAGRAS